MPRFFFDYRDGNGLVERDEDGIGVPSIETAYKVALQAAVEMYEEAREKGWNATDHSFEVRDETGRILLVIPLAEALPRLQSRKS
jgi:uncharacterized protein DUF6894